jgi:uncharacterized protein with NAD-binding domain and iron-sulfur cluster
MTNRPPYLYPAGSVVMHSPLELKQADMYGFFVKGDLAKLQASVDATLNAVAESRLEFKVLSPYVMLTFTRVAHANSANPVDQDKGWITETDIITWVMLAQVDASGKTEHIYFHPMHIWVDDTMALINGRELFGYPKYDCQYTMPEPGGDAKQCTLTVKGFEPFSPQTEIAWHPLLEVNATNTSQPHKKLEGWLELVEQLIELFKSMPDALNLDAAGWEDVLSLLLKPRTDQIFLKQFPDSAGVSAVYQAIVAAPANVTAVHSVKLLGYEYEAVLHRVASFPLADSLGLQLGSQAAILPFNLNFDFTVTPGEELVNNSSLEPEKIAILGGGVGSMTTAYYLSAQPGNYDITVYQMGWRLGGKGASGRNAQHGQRIEEHGLHIWFGFYENAFSMIQEAYGALNRPPEAPLAAWTDAFKPQDYISLTEDIAGQWKTWDLVFPTKPGTPGDGAERLGLWTVARDLLAWIKQWLKEIKTEHDKQLVLSSGAHPDWLHQLAQACERAVDDLAFDVVLAADCLETTWAALEGKFEQHGILLNALRGLKAWLEREIASELDDSDTLRRLFICVDLGITVLTGMLEDGVFKSGFDVINDIDFQAWLTKHGANVQYSVDSAPVRGFYDLIFAYENGDFAKPNAEAGTLLRSMMLIGMAYQGSIMFKMQAGMGDTIFTPLYQVLKARGVKFKFFHKLEEVVPDGDEISSLRFTQQVALNSGPDFYDPLVYVNGLASWPNAPKLEQIVQPQAELLQANSINLESNWTNWNEVYAAHYGQPLPQLTLERGKDFDRVIFGISIGAFSQLCPQLLPLNPALQTMTDTVQTVATQAYQVWFNQDLETLGWKNHPNGQEPVLSGFTEPFDTWAPMDQLLKREAWKPGPQEPKNVSYFCSALPVSSYPPSSDYTFPGQIAAQVKASAVNQLETQIGALLPGTTSSNAFNWNWVSDYGGSSGAARFDSQYWRANIDPSERYVMSVVNSTQHRLHADQSGFKNLYFAGDWLKTGINAGCVEAAVMGGMQASRAISGYPQIIKGETDKL